jgi:hypothetical protein
VNRRIINFRQDSFHQDDVGEWIADLECGHSQHVRHQPPWTLRPWVLSEEGRREFLGYELLCVKCAMPHQGSANATT